MRKIRILLMTLCVAGMLCGCGEAAEEANVSGESVAVEGDEAVVDVGTVGDVEATTNDAVQEADSEVVEEDDVEGSNEIETWFEEQGFTEPTVVIWDTESGEKIVMETNGEDIKEYEFGEEDKLLLYYASPVNESYLSSPLEIGEIYTTYDELYAEFDTGILCIIENIVEGKSYKQKFTLVRPKSDVE